MAKIGVNLKIDVSKIDKARMFKGEKGVYLDCTAFIDLDVQDQYGNNGMITQAWKDQQKGEGAILGNSRIFWTDGNAASAPSQQTAPQQTAPDDFDDEVPF